MKLRIHVVDQLEIYSVMEKNVAISSVVNTIKNIYIQTNLHFIYQQDLYRDKQKVMYDIFIEYLVSIMHYLYHPELIE